MKRFRQKTRQGQQMLAALTLTSILSLSVAANAVEPSFGSVNSILKNRSEAVASPKQNDRQIPRAVVNAVRREIAREFRVPPGQLRVTSFSQESWPNSCLGLGRPREACAEIFIENGWRIVMSNGEQNWTYRTDGTGRLLRLEGQQTPPSGSLPDSVTNGVLRAASEQLNISTSQLRITQSERQDWPDGCLGLARDNERCTGAITPGWRVTVETKQQRLVYRTDRNGSFVRLDEQASNIGSGTLPQAASNAILQAASQRTGLRTSELRIVKSQQITTDGCLGLPRPREACTRIALQAWEVTVEAGQQRLVYRSDVNGSQVRLNEAASTISDRNLPKSVSDRVLQSASQETGLRTSNLRIVQADKQSWPDGCLGLYEPNVLCTMAIVPGWRVTVEAGDSRLVYRTNDSGSVVKLDKPGTYAGSGAVPIPRSELPPPLPSNTIFRAIASGGIAGQTTETRLQDDGQVVRLQVIRNGLMAPMQVSRISRQDVQKFQQLLERTEFSQFDQLSYPVSRGADYITVTLTGKAGTTRYVDIAADRLPLPLQEVVKAWNQIASGS